MSLSWAENSALSAMDKYCFSRNFFSRLFSCCVVNGVLGFLNEISFWWIQSRDGDGDGSDGDLLPVWFMFPKCTSERTHWWTNVWKEILLLDFSRSCRQFCVCTCTSICTCISICIYICTCIFICICICIWSLAMLPVQWWKCQQVIRILQTPWPILSQALANIRLHQS